MIEFNYTIQNEEILISLKTDITEIGTFHRMAAVIYGLDWDILSGDIKTIVEEDKKYTFDLLKLKTESKNSKHASDLGILMETIFGNSGTVEEFMKNRNIDLRLSKKIFTEDAELIFEDDPPNNHTILYVEADSAKGLLFHLTGVLAEYELDIISGIITTNQYGRAEDTFYLLDKNGQMFGSTPRAEEIRNKILSKL